MGAGELSRKPDEIMTVEDGSNLQWTAVPSREGGLAVPLFP